MAGVCLRTYLVHSTYVFLVTRATKDGKIVNPAVSVFFCPQANLPSTGRCLLFLAGSLFSLSTTIDHAQTDGKVFPFPESLMTTIDFGEKETETESVSVSETETCFRFPVETGNGNTFLFPETGFRFHDVI